MAESSGSKTASITKGPYRAIISVNNPQEPSKTYDEEIVKQVFEDNNMGNQPVKQVTLNNKKINTFYVDLDVKQIAPERSTAPKPPTAEHLQMLGNLAKAKPHEVASQMSMIPNVGDLPEERPTTEQVALNAATAFISDAVEASISSVVALDKPQRVFMKLHQSFGDGAAALSWRYDRKIAMSDATVHEDLVTNPIDKGTFNRITYDAAPQPTPGNTTTSLIKHSIPQELDFDDDDDEEL